MDLKVFVHSLLSEPVFLIPLLSFLFGIRISNEIIIIITVFQILSAVSLQMGKYVPPEFAAGGVVSFILYTYSSLSLSLSLIAGIFASLLMIPAFELKIRLNKILASKMIYPWAVASAVGISYALYAAIIFLFSETGILLSSHLNHNSSIAVFSLLSLPFFYAVRLKSRNEPAYFILGVVFGGIITWINAFIF
ncbi:MAG: hypothetical protein PHW02_08965 [bacterium]|nr:hypothetical protein [bacterium]